MLSFVTNFVLPLGIHPDALGQNAQNSMIAESSVLLGSRKPQDLILYIMRQCVDCVGRKFCQETMSGFKTCTSGGAPPPLIVVSQEYSRVPYHPL